MEISLMDVIRGILWNAAESGLSLNDVKAMAEAAEDLDDWDAAINTLALATPQRDLLADVLEK